MGHEGPPHGSAAPAARRLAVIRSIDSKRTVHQELTLLAASTSAGASTKSSHSRYSSARP